MVLNAKEEYCGIAKHRCPDIQLGQRRFWASDGMARFIQVSFPIQLLLIQASKLQVFIDVSLQRLDELRSPPYNLVSRYLSYSMKCYKTT